MTEDQLSRRQDSQKDIGSQGEDFVLRYERQRLADLIGAPASTAAPIAAAPIAAALAAAGRPPRLSEVAIVGRQDVGLGYDIASF